MSAAVVVRVPWWWTQKQGDIGGDPEVGEGKMGRGQVSQLGVLEGTLPSLGLTVPLWEMGRRCSDASLRGPKRPTSEALAAKIEVGGVPSLQLSREGLPPPFPMPCSIGGAASLSPAGPAPTSWVCGPEPPHLLTCLLQTGSPWGAGQSEGSQPTQLPPRFWLDGLCDSSKSCSFLGSQFPHPKSEEMINTYLRMS